MDTLSAVEQAALRTAADDSNYTSADWAAALAVLDAFLKQEGRTAPFETRLGYISCCAELAARDPMRPALAHIAEDMLAEYGFTG